MEPIERDLDAVETEQHTEPMVLNLGPAHPCTHGTVRIVVELQGETVVRAGSEQAARMEAARVVQQGEEWGLASEVIGEVKALYDLPSGWDGQCRPFGKRDELDRPLAEQLAEIEKKAAENKADEVHDGPYDVGWRGSR